jgi:hypothetical protein
LIHFCGRWKTIFVLNSYITLNTYSHIIKSKEEQAANSMEAFYTQQASQMAKNG